MTRQQAGVSASLSEIIARAKSKTPCASNYECLLADLLELQAALATAPPEQAACDSCGATVKDGVLWHEDHCKKAASAGALREKLKQVIGSRIGVCDQQFYDLLLDDIVALLAAYEQANGRAAETYPGQAFFHKHNANIKRAEEHAASAGALDELRKAGWMVAVHNDYRQDGQSKTFWLLVKDGQAVRGEGTTDGAAISQIVEHVVALAAHDQADEPEPESTGGIYKGGSRYEGTNDIPTIHGQAELAAHDQKVRAEATLAEHKSHVDFENELYATLVDPVAEGSIKEAEMRKQLLEQARWYRQRVYDLEQVLPLDARRLKMILLDIIVLADAGKWKGQLSTVNYARAALAAPAASKPEASNE